MSSGPIGVHVSVGIDRQLMLGLQDFVQKHQKPHLLARIDDIDEMGMLTVAPSRTTSASLPTLPPCRHPKTPI
jgi:hypothetical protein